MSINEFDKKSIEMHYPEIASKTVEYRERGREILCKLNNGKIFSYYVSENSMRELPINDDDYTKEACKDEFGVRFRRLLRRSCITQAELSRKTGLTQPQLSNYINGKVLPSLYIAEKLARALDCSIEDFIPKY